MSGCEEWIDVPTAMIDQAEKIGSSRCKDHSHPVFKLQLKEPKTPETRILYSLLAQRTSAPGLSPMPMGSMQPAQLPQIGRRGPLGGALPVHPPATNVAYWPVGDGRYGCSGWLDCLHMAGDIRCADIQCYTGWATGDLVCFCTPG
jgi:hypothetical protein